MSAGAIIGILLGLVKLANVFFQWAQENKWIAEGEARAYAKQLAQNLRITNYAKHALEEITNKSDSELDDFLRDLEPGPDDGKR